MRLNKLEPFLQTNVLILKVCCRCLRRLFLKQEKKILQVIIFFPVMIEVSRVCFRDRAHSSRWHLMEGISQNTEAKNKNQRFT